MNDNIHVINGAMNKFGSSIFPPTPSITVDPTPVDPSSLPPRKPRLTDAARFATNRFIPKEVQEIFHQTMSNLERKNGKPFTRTLDKVKSFPEKLRDRRVELLDRTVGPFYNRFIEPAYERFRGRRGPALNPDSSNVHELNPIPSNVWDFKKQSSSNNTSYGAGIAGGLLTTLASKAVLDSSGDGRGLGSWVLPLILGVIGGKASYNIADGLVGDASKSLKDTRPNPKIKPSEIYPWSTYGFNSH